jgi:hypothetical protein
MGKNAVKYISVTVAVLFSLAFIVVVHGPKMLRLYIEGGIGNCQSIPILCMEPGNDLVRAQANKEYIAELLAYTFPRMSISVPKGFTVVQEVVKKVYYKKLKRSREGARIYLLREEKKFFINLFPQLTRAGVADDYEFIKRMMYANLKGIKGLPDAFFIVIKGIFTPDLGDQKNVLMIRLAVEDKKGFLSYNLGNEINYFDCNIFNDRGDFFKIYIRDQGATLDLEKVFSIISTVKPVD